MNNDDIKFVPKGWGYEKWICNTSEYCGKLLFFAKGKRCSWHYHLLKDETLLKSPLFLVINLLLSASIFITSSLINLTPDSKSDS